jgi:hypothetical protein
LLLWLAPAVAISAPSVAPEIPVGMTRPYLAIVGAPGLRFAERISAPANWSPPPHSNQPPQPTKEEPAKPDSETSAPSESKAHTQGAPDIAVGPETNPATPQQPIGKQSPGNPPVPILPDDSHPKVRPEDFLPFFQFPGLYHEINNNPNPPPTPSSATYRQT